MIKGSKEYLDRMIEKLQCPEHPDKALVVAWDKTEGYVVRCGAGHYPEEIKPIPSRTEQFKRGTLQKVDPMFNLLPKADLATGEMLSPEMIQALVSYARTYGLDAYRGHVVLMYGAPYIGFDGYLYHADKLNEPYTLNSRPLSEDERKTYQVNEGDHVWTATVKILRNGAEFTGLGIVAKNEMTEMSKKKPDHLRSPVVAAHPWQLAQKRAEWQAMRRAFPIGESEPAGEGSQ